MTHDFVINTENVNEYKYRILTDGIDYTQYMRNPVVLFMHERDDNENRGSEVIGKCLKLFVKDKQLIATVEFDVADDFAKKIAGKVERDMLRMASMYAEVIEASSDPALVASGQVYETVTKCKLVEISIVDIGGNDDALKLSKKGSQVNLKKLNIKKENMSELKTIALALGKAADTPENVLLETIAKVKLDKDTLESKVVSLETEIKKIRLSSATVLVDKAVSLGLIPEALKDSQLKSFDADFDGQTAILSKLIQEEEAKDTQKSNQNAVKQVVLNGKSSTNSTTTEETFDYLQKHDTVKLAKIREEQPEQYAALAKAYANGVRHKE